jgi:hypothetical protein
LSLSNDLFRLLGQIAKNQSEIRLLNIYRGLPISYDTNINSVGNFEIQVPASKQHIACLYYQRETYLQGEKLPFLIRSQVTSLNLAKEDARLANFEVARPDIGKRAQIRVEPDEPLIAIIQFINSGYELPAPLTDISAEGASIHLETHLFPVRQFKPGNELMISIPFPDTVSQKIIKLATRPLVDRRGTRPFPQSAGWQDGKVTISARGKVVSVLPELELNRYRVGMQLYFQNLARTVILQYISQRQAEIIRDLRILSDELYSRTK